MFPITWLGITTPKTKDSPVASKHLKTYIALLSLTTCKKENVWEFLSGIAKKEGVSDKELRALMEREWNRIDMPEEFLCDWLMFQGRVFEGYMANRLNRFFDIVNWTSDKCFGTVMAPNASDPDLTLLRSGNKRFSVECKWHNPTEQRRLNDLAKFAKNEEQVERYKEYQDKNMIKCFIAIGYGRKGNDIQELYFVPLDYIIEIEPESNTIPIFMIEQYRVTNDQMLKEIIEEELNG